MGICLSRRRSNIEPSVPTPEKTQPSQPTSIPDGTTSTPSPKPGTGTAKSARVRAQPQGRALSQRRLNDGRDYPPLSSGGNLFTSKHPDRQKIRSPLYLSGRTGPMRWIRSVSMDVTALQSAPSHLSSRRNRTASTAGHGSGYRRVGIQSMSGLPSATGKITAGRQRGQPRFPPTLPSLLSNDFRYAVGRSIVPSVHDY
jgi:hypothetical protein